MLSQCTIAAVSAASIIFNLPKRHPQDPTNTLIAYELLLAMTPALLAGVGVGVIFNVAFPTWLITTMLIGLLAFMSTRTAQKGLQQWRSETQAKRQAAAAAEGAGRPQEAEQMDGSASSTTDASESAAGAVVVIADPETAAAATAASAAGGEGKAGRAPYPWVMAALVVVLWCGFGALQLSRQQAVKCSPAFYLVLAAQVGACGCVAGCRLNPRVQNDS